MKTKAGGEGEGEKDGGWGKVCFLSRVKETLMVNLAHRQTNVTPRQRSVTPTPLTVHTIPEFPK